MTSSIKSYRDLRVWQLALDLAPEVYKLAQSLPRYEQYGLADQMRRAVISVPANIAEGQARRHRREFLRYLSIARGSLAELETLLVLAERLEYLNAESLRVMERAIADVRMPLAGLMNRLRSSEPSPTPPPDHRQ
jgi:four helix bundle protein